MRARSVAWPSTSGELSPALRTETEVRRPVESPKSRLRMGIWLIGTSEAGKHTVSHTEL